MRDCHFALSQNRQNLSVCVALVQNSNITLVRAVLSSVSFFLSAQSCMVIKTQRLDDKNITQKYSSSGQVTEKFLSAFISATLSYLISCLMFYTKGDFLSSNQSNKFSYQFTTGFRRLHYYR